MAHKEHSSRWLSLFLLILLCTILLQAASSSSSASASATALSHALLHKRGSRGSGVTQPQPRSIDPESESTDPQELRSNSLLSERAYAPATSFTTPEVVQEDDESDSVDVDEDDQELEEEEEESEALAQDPRLRQNKASGLVGHRRDVKTTSYNCDSQTPQTLGPAWNGTFMSNAPDGVYPSETRSCTWTIQAMPAIASVTGSAPYIVELKFWTPIQLVCGIDYLTVYDGPDTTSPVIAHLCGNIWMDNLPVLYSSGSTMTAVFSTQARSPGSFGFKAGWISVLPCNICSGNGRGACNANTCSCNSRYTGSVCQTETAGSKDFTPRSQHAMAYDADKDIVYITGGTNFETPFLSLADVVTYSFASNKWNKLSSKKKAPYARLGHYSFMYNNDVYIYGGVTNYAGMADVWRFVVSSKQWLEQTVTNTDLAPKGRRGAACVFISTGNYTGRLYVFGGMDSAGETVRELRYFDLATSRWSNADHKNSVGLTGATAIYHHPTDSIYFFGGMVNQTTRNVVPYQYFIQQDLWHALPPKFDPLTSTPVSSPYKDGYDQAPRPLNFSSGDNNEPDGEEGSSLGQYSAGQQYLPPVMYDPISAVWAPADVMREDIVVVFGGMRPFGLGSNVRDQSCYARSVSMYDLSCQNWTSFDVTETTGGSIKTRVNHTMVIRPPSGGNRTSWTAYIFGGFDGANGAHRSDVLNITLNLAPMADADVNNCRALRWCNLYDDCQNCNPTYCSYVNGLCLFDTDKAKASSTPSSAPFYLLGVDADVPRNGTVQDLIRQRPELQSQVLTSLDTCPARTALDVGTVHEYEIQPGQEMTFKTYIDAQDHDILFEIRTTPPTMSLQFSSLNVWEGYMNMYWRATHGLTDDSWDGASGTSSPIPSDIPPQSPGRNGTMPPDGPVITLAGVLNTSELLNRWTKYAGLDGSPSSSARRETVSSTDVLFLAGDPRRFSGYYVYSISNSNSEKVSFTLMVTLINHSDGDDGAGKPKFDLATLGFFMVGFIVGVLLLVLVGRKIRKMLEEREQDRRAAAELRMFQEEEEEEERRRQEAMATASPDRGSLKDMKPMYRVVVGVQNQQDWDLLGTPMLGLQPNTLRHRSIRHSAPMSMSAAAATTTMTTSLEVPKRTSMSTAEALTPPTITTTPAAVWESTSTLPRSWSDPIEIRVIDDQEDRRSSSGRSSDVIRDLGSMPLTSRLGRSKTERQSSTERSLTSLQRTWSLSSLSRSSSVKRFLSPGTRTVSEEKEGLADSCCSQMSTEEESNAEDLGAGIGSQNDHDHEVIELGTLARDGTDIDESQAVVRAREHRNPTRVQPISIEPLPFHGGLVPRTRRHLLRYQRTLRRQASYAGSPRGSIGGGAPASRRRGRAAGVGRESGTARGALQTARTAASRLTLLTTRGGSIRYVAGRGRPLGKETRLPGVGDGSESGVGDEDSRGRRIKMREQAAQEQEYEPGPLLAVNVLIVFPGDAGTRRVLNASVEKEKEKEKEEVEEEEGEGEERLPPMAIGTVIVPDPVRWWAYKARQQVDRRRFEREMRRLHLLKKEACLPEKAMP